MQNFAAMCGPVFLAGALNSLAQTAIKLTAPGVPDIYQGSELWELSLVDPDNRRAVDYEHCRSLQASVGDAAPEALLATGAPAGSRCGCFMPGWRCARARKTLFAAGDYVPLTVEGDAAENVFAYARVSQDAGGHYHRAEDLPGLDFGREHAAGACRALGRHRRDAACSARGEKLARHRHRRGPGGKEVCRSAWCWGVSPWRCW